MQRTGKSTSFLRAVPLEWLLKGEAFVRYSALVDLLDNDPDDNEVRAVRQYITRQKVIKRILLGQNEHGYWGNPRDIVTWWPKKDTTFWVLGVLADFGLTRQNRRVARACEYVFSKQLPVGAFGWAPPPTPGDCFTGILVESLAKLGFGRDPRLSRAYAWLVNRQRLDGGFWCKKTGLPGGPRESEPSCAFATLCVLGALVQSLELKEGETARRAVEFLFRCWKNRGRIKYAGHDSQIGKGWEKLKYPFTDYKILKYLDILSRSDIARTDPRIARITDRLMKKADRDGRFYAESIHKVWSDFDFGQKKKPSRWITLLVYRILKRLHPGQWAH